MVPSPTKDCGVSGTNGDHVTKSNIDLTQVDNIPEVGMMFSDEETSYKFYNAYAKMTGFSVRKGMYRRLADGTVRQRIFLCSKQGQRRPNDSTFVLKINRLETRTNCLAQITFTVENGAWIISKFAREHNHELVLPQQQDMLTSHRNISAAQANVITEMDGAGIKPTHIFGFLKEQAGGVENVGFLRKDCENYLHNKRQKIFELGDAQNVLDHFRSMQSDDPSFFYSVDLDDESRLRSFFWSDGRSKVDYSYFGDVVIFDTTYRTNKYDMICAPFIGVNHHKQNILLGCAFLLYETVGSFIWLFKTFLKAMGGKQPQSIFTDQCAAMANAINHVFPETQHRLCLWHIGQNAPKHLSYYLRIPLFKKLFSKCLYNCQTEREFQEVWQQIQEKFDMSENTWLKTLYNLRQKWCPAFSKNYFSAGILSTQRSECMNSVFRKVTSKTTTLTQFVLRYEKVCERMRHSELLNDFKCNQGMIPGVEKIGGMVRQAANEYTHVVFHWFNEELQESLFVAIEDGGSDGNGHAYRLIKDGDDKAYVIKFQVSDFSIDCSFKKFESVGILCLHALKVLNARNIFHIPPQYIMKRWTKSAKSSVAGADQGKTCTESGKSSISLRMSQIMQKAIILATKGSLTDESTSMAEDILEHGLKKIENFLKTEQVQINVANKEIESELEDDMVTKGGSDRILDPLRRKKKGQKNIRYKSILEKNIKKKGKTRIGTTKFKGKKSTNEGSSRHVVSNHETNFNCLDDVSVFTTQIQDRNTSTIAAESNYFMPSSHASQMPIWPYSSSNTSYVNCEQPNGMSYQRLLLSQVEQRTDMQVIDAHESSMNK